MAILRPPADAALLAGIDPVLDGVHFDLTTDGPVAAGRKAVNRNLSDVAAMGGTPTALLLSIVTPKSLSMNDVQNIYLGAEAAGRAFNCPIVGGDFASWDGRLVVTVAVLGSSTLPLPRTGTRLGQTLYVTGPLGGSILGRHLTFEPRILHGQLLAAQADTIGLTAVMDLSDGLSRDLPRLVEPHGAEIDAQLVMPHQDAIRLGAASGQEPLWHALHDGEDYELLFAADRKPEGLPAFPIGKVIAQGMLLLHNGITKTLQPLGWQHVLNDPNA